MTSTSPAMTLDGVLEQFMMEDAHDGTTLARYVRAYPLFALQLIDLSRLIATPDAQDSEEPLSAPDQSRIDAAWIIHKTAAPAPSTDDDPFAALTGARGKAVAVRFGVPRQVITGFREHRVDPSTVPAPIARVFADEFELPLAHVIAAMQRPTATLVGRSFKAENKPGAAGKISFEQLLIDAGMSEADRVRLLANG
ncbi:hypothetical protein [Brevundimonas sp. ZS04]|uniref:hypothetical protein n=1 Tax=Brevundimonas sp. ZS04 TaxID=1906854 RepID=UPI00096DB62F|nr:hypothetical protein [Brevundimonas sp. ZS04]OMG60523.1 hypothetical protein BJP32_00290 [Brevundimonas sp. ZS04]